MTNTMDDILVEYEQTSKSRVTLREFLSIPTNKLPKKQQKIQRALDFIYKQNEKDPPLFSRFPNWRQDKPLTIDCVSALTTDDNTTAASFNIFHNVIRFQNTKRSIDFIEVLAHELKHAEQASEESYILHASYFKQNHYRYHQLSFLEEAQAYLFGNYVSMLQVQNPTIKTIGTKMTMNFTYKSKLFNGFCHYQSNAESHKMMGIRQYIKTHPDIQKWNYQDFEKTLLPSVYVLIQNSKFFPYKNDYDLIAPIKRCDLQQIESSQLDFKTPKSWRISKGTWPIIHPVAGTPRTRFKQLFADIADDETIAQHDMRLIENADSNKYGKYILTPEDKNDYITLLLSHGQVKHVAFLFKDETFLPLQQQTLHILVYVRQKVAENQPLQPEEMDFIELKNQQGSFILNEPCPFYKYRYLNLLYATGNADRVNRLHSQKFLDLNMQNRYLQQNSANGR